MKLGLLESAQQCWAHVKPIDPGEGLDPDWVSQFPLHTRGRYIVDAHGRRFRFRGINWYGASDAYHVVGGLDVQRLDTICGTVSALGFNVVRIPFSNEMLRANTVTPGSVNLEINPELSISSPLEILDAVVKCLGRHKVAVVLNNHTTYGEWCGGPDRNGLWFSPGSKEYTEERWFQDWAMLAKRYRKCSHVVGFDLRNEVRFCPWPLRWPSWEGGFISRLFGGCDWAAAAEACADRIVSENEDALIIVERVIWPMRSLSQYSVCPGPLLPKLQNRLVLAVHHYSWNGPGRYLAFGHLMTSKVMRLVKTVVRKIGLFSQANYGDMSCTELFEELLQQWGFLLEEDICPVWVSEFGADPENGYDKQWFERFVRFLVAMDVDWAYWPLNVGRKPGSEEGEPYGMLNPDWTPKPKGDARLDILDELLTRK